MIKLKDLINELGINNPNPTADDVYNYYINNILSNDIEFDAGTKGWEEYEIIEEYYMKKYKLSYIGLTRYNCRKLPQSDLNKFYRELKQLVNKYTININEKTKTNT